MRNVFQASVWLHPAKNKGDRPARPVAIVGVNELPRLEAQLISINASANAPTILGGEGAEQVDARALARHSGGVVCKHTFRFG
jgi:hypothetical protein